MISCTNEQAKNSLRQYCFDTELNVDWIYGNHIQNLIWVCFIGITHM